ncbi:MAG: cobalamin-independent methionine synthase II family protein [Thermoplasmata archaeon]
MTGHLKDVAGVPIAATHVGAFARPSWYTNGIYGADFRSLLARTAFREQYFDATKVLMAEQQSAGLNIVTDGGLRYDPQLGGWGWPSFVLSRLGGVESGGQMAPVMAPTPVLMEMMNAMIPGIVTSDITPGRLQFAEFYKAAARFTSQPLRFTVIDPTLVNVMLTGTHYKNPVDQLFALARAYNHEFKALVEAGCTIIQTDDFFAALAGAFAPLPEDQWKVAIEAFNAAVQGVTAHIWMHFCWGRPMNQLAFGAVGSYEALFRHAAEIKADLIQIEAASTGGDNLARDLAVWKDHCPEKEIGIGVVNHRTTQVESTEQVVATIQKALKFVAPEHLAVSCDCGLSALPRDVAYYKLKAIGDGARKVRSGLEH